MRMYTVRNPPAKPTEPDESAAETESPFVIDAAKVPNPVAMPMLSAVNSRLRG